MRYATANTAGNATYSDLLDSCPHSRLRAALASHLPAPTRRSSSPAAAATVPVSDATKAYLWVAGMSVFSLFSVIVSGTVAA